MSPLKKTNGGAVTTTAPAPVAKPTAPAKGAMEVAKKGDMRKEAEIITRLKDKDAADGLYQIILQLTGGDTLFVDKFVQCCKMQVDAAWKRGPDGKWFNPYFVIPLNEQLKALYRCASKKVLPDGYNCYLVPYLGRDKKTLDVRVDYKGLVDCLVKEGIIMDCGAMPVCANDDFEWSLGEVTKFRFDPRKKRGEVCGYVAWAVLPSGRKKWEWMDNDEIQKVRDCAMTDNIWDEWTGEMAKKTVIRRMFKTLPNTPRLRGLIELDNENFDMERGKDGVYRYRGAEAGQSGHRSAPVRQVVHNQPAALPTPEQPSQPADAVVADTGAPHAAQPELEPIPAQPAEDEAAQQSDMVF